MLVKVLWADALGALLIMGILMNPMKTVEVVAKKNAENVGTENTFRRRKRNERLSA